MKKEKIITKTIDDELSDIEQTLSEYGEAEIVDNSTDVETEKNEEDESYDTNSSIINGYDFSDKSNSELYFQSGKKKGQLRPKGQRIKEGKEKPSIKHNPENRKFSGKKLISGKMLLTSLNVIIPSLMMTANNQLSKKKVSTSSLRLKQQQINDLQSVADEFIDTLEIEANPIYMLLLGLGACYGSNLIEARNNE